MLKRVDLVLTFFNTFLLLHFIWYTWTQKGEGEICKNKKVEHVKVQNTI